jgi:hypothetical protein
MQLNGSSGGNAKEKMTAGIRQLEWNEMAAQ